MHCCACALAAGLASVAALASFAPFARALDLGQDGNLQTGTAGLREWLKKSSDAKQHGAERIQDRDRTPYQPDGIRAGRFLILPSFGADGLYDDNIFAAPRDKKADYRSELTPVIRVQSDFTRHVFKFTAGSKIVNHERYRELDYIDAFARLDTALHFDHAHTLSFSAGSGLLHEERSDPFALKSAKEPVAHFDNTATLALTRDAGRLYGTFSLIAAAEDYRNVEALDGTMIDQDFRDSETYTAQLRFGYRFSPGFEFLSKTKVLRQLTGDRAGGDRNNIGIESVAGLSFQTSPLLRFKLLAGYGYRQYDRDDFDNVGSALLEAGVEWLPTQRLTVSANLRREINGISPQDGSLHVETEVNGKLQYEIWRNLLLTSTAFYNDAKGASDNRHDRTYGGGIGLEYLHTKYWAFNLGYDFTERQSNLDELDFQRNRVRIGAKLRF